MHYDTFELSGWTIEVENVFDSSASSCESLIQDLVTMDLVRNCELDSSIFYDKIG